MKKAAILIVLIGVALVFMLYRGYAGAVRYALDPDSTDRMIVDIPEGSTGTEAAQILAQKGLIRSSGAFTFYLKQMGLEDQIRAGRFVLQENFAMPEIVDLLVKGKSQEFSVTLLEGWTALQMAEFLAAEGLTEPDAFMDCVQHCQFDFDFLPEGKLEGYLYPDTYFVNPGTYSDEAFIGRLIGTLKNKLSDDDWEAINASDRDFSEIMIMASIVEREERDEAERATVAGILWNRFDAGIGLGADATILYALGRTKGGLSFEDLQVDSPYNTRKYAGLPPTPISNPSISSIRAALYPQATDYWYYLHDSKGGIHYAKTLDEHNVNKARYL